MNPPFILVGDVISHETEIALRQLSSMARRRRNRLIGLAFAGMVMGPDERQCFTNAAGECYRNPLYARGIVSELHDALGVLSHGVMPFGWSP